MRRMRKNKFVEARLYKDGKIETGNKGLIGRFLDRFIEDGIVKIKLWKAIIIIILMCIGSVCIATYLLNSLEKLVSASTEKITETRVVSGIVDGIKDPKGKFNIPNTPITIRPDYKNTGRIYIKEPKEVTIAGAGDQHKEGK